MTMHPAVSNGAYDVARVREDFPALAMKVYGKPLVYLDNAASAQKPTAVLDRMTEAYKSEYANVHRGLHYLANAATEAYEGGRAKVAKFLNAARTEQYDALISDIGMPGMNGYELAEQVRGLPGYERVPMIAVTGFTMYDDRDRALASGFDAFLTKPISPNDLIQLLAGLRD